MEEIDLLLQPRWLIPVVPEGAVLDAHALAVHQGRIVAVLPAAEAAQRFSPAQRITLPEHALLPGLVNAHTHAAMALMRGLADDLPLMRWLNDHIWPAEGAVVSETFTADGVRLACAEMIRSGITCFSDMYFFPEVIARTAREAGMRAAVGLIVLDFPTPQAANADEYLSQAMRSYDALKAQPLVHPVLAPHAPYTVSDAPLRKLRALAHEINVPIHMHIHETADEVQGSIRDCGQRPLARLDALDLLGNDLIAVHMTQLTDDEIALIARNGVHVVHCPQSNLKLASGFCPVARLQDAGVNVALGTDGAASNNDLDLLDEMRTAAMLTKAVAGDATALPAPRALTMATLAGARALGIEHECGSLEAGKSADCIAIDLSDLGSQPVFDAISSIVYSAQRSQITDTFVAGRALMRNARLQTLDTAAIRERVAHWHGELRPFAWPKRP